MGQVLTHKSVSNVTSRDAARSPPPWSVDDPDMKLGQERFIVRDASEQALAT
jgi:hypothetical protein